MSKQIYEIVIPESKEKFLVDLKRIRSIHFDSNEYKQWNPNSHEWKLRTTNRIEIVFIDLSRNLSIDVYPENIELVWQELKQAWQEFRNCGDMR